MENKTIGFAVCGSFCTHARAMEALEQVKARFARVIPIVSECTAATDTRFGCAHELMREMARICDHRVISTIAGAEPIGPQKLLDLLIIAPCTGNTLGKLAAGVTDTSVTMAAKAHLRNGRPILLAPSTNDGLAGSAPSLGALLNRRYIYFVPFGQDDPERKPTSLVSDFSQVAAAAQAAEALAAHNPRFCAVCLAEPDALQHYPFAASTVSAWDRTEPAMRAVCRALANPQI